MAAREGLGAGGFARPVERPAGRVRLAREGMLAGVTFAMGALLTLVFPSARDFDLNANALPIGAYAAAYLEVLVKANPRDWSARLAFVRQLHGRGELQRALDELDLVPRTGESRAPAEGLALEISWAALRAIPVGDPARGAAIADVGQRLETLAQDGAGSPEELSHFADLALQIERPRLAARFYARLGEVVTGEARPRALAEAGRWSLAGGDPAGAAALYDAAALATGDLALESTWARRSVAAAEAAGDARVAADRAALWLARRPGDLALLSEAARVSLAANRPRAARDLGRRLVRARPDDPVERERQALRELAAGSPEAAWPLVQEAVERHPNDSEWREREARTAEWTGRPRVALRDWLWLAGARGRRSENVRARTSP